MLYISSFALGVGPIPAIMTGEAAMSRAGPVMWPDTAQSGRLAEAGRSLGQPGRAPALNAAFRSAGQGGLLSTLGRHASALKSENEMLRRCLQDSRTPGAFESYLRASTTY